MHPSVDLRRHLPAASCLLLAAALATPITAQCALSLQTIPAATAQARLAIAALPNGDLVVGGSFTSIAGVAANAVARWDGSAWHPLGAGMSGAIFFGTTSTVTALLVLPNGDVVAAGDFTSAGAVTTNSIARWDGSAWHAFGAGINGIVRSLAALPNGDVVAGGLFPAAGTTLVNHVARWDGAAWHAMGAGMNTYFVHALAAMPNGDLIAGGNFWQAGGVAANKIARWDGASWHPLGTGMSDGAFATEVYSLATLPNGDLIAGGNFTVAGGVAAHNIARWDGAAWSALGAGVATDGLFAQPRVDALSVLPNGDVLAGGNFTMAGGAAVNHLARWDGVSWSQLGGGADGAVGDLAAMPNGDRIVNGAFTTIDGVTTDGLARLVTDCPASATSYGSGCGGAGGPTALTARALPWIGGAFRATATGLPADALAVGIFAFGQLALPMPAVHPAGAPGCDLLVTDEILWQFRVSNGAVETSIDVPDALPLVGGVFYHQVVPIELDAGGAITAMTSTNALELVVGAF